MIRSLIRPLCLVCLVLCGTVHGSTITFGPRSYAQISGKPVTYSDAFTVDVSDDCDGKAHWVLRIENGDEHHSAVSSALVRLNGAVAADEADFRGGVTRFERPVRLYVNNSLEVTVSGGGPVSRVTVSITREIEERVVHAPHLEAGAEHRWTESVDVADVASTFVVTVLNGDASGGHRVSTGTVSINGETVVDERELRQSSPGVRTYVRLQRQNEISAVVHGTPGSYVSVAVGRVLDETACAPKVVILTPREDEAVTGFEVLIRGTVSGSRDVGVVVNGVVTAMDLSHAGTVADPIPWFAVITPENEGTVELTAVGTNDRGAEGRAQAKFVFTKAPPSVRLRALMQEGVAPFEALFEVHTDAYAPTPSTYEFDLDGDGTFESGAVAPIPEELIHTFVMPGVYHPRMRTTAANGTAEISETYIAVHKFGELDSVIRKRWATLRQALAVGDVEGAVKLFEPGSRDKHRSLLVALRPKLAGIAATMSDSLRGAVDMTADYAYYLIIREENGEKVAHYVSFVRGENGTWAIADM